MHIQYKYVDYSKNLQTDSVTRNYGIGYERDSRNISQW